MAGMLQIITYVLCFYLVVKGIEILQIALASGREKRTALFVIGGLTVAACIIAALSFASMQDSQAMSLSSNFTPPSVP